MLLKPTSTLTRKVVNFFRHPQKKVFSKSPPSIYPTTYSRATPPHAKTSDPPTNPPELTTHPRRKKQLLKSSLPRLPANHSLLNKGIDRVESLQINLYESEAYQHSGCIALAKQLSAGNPHFERESIALAL